MANTKCRVRRHKLGVSLTGESMFILDAARAGRLTKSRAQVINEALRFWWEEVGWANLDPRQIKRLNRPKAPKLGASCCVCGRRAPIDSKSENLVHMDWAMGDGPKDVYCPDHAYLLSDERLLQVLEAKPLDEVAISYRLANDEQWAGWVDVYTRQHQVQKALLRLREAGFVEYANDGRWAVVA
jgi:hypothetical protein